MRGQKCCPANSMECSLSSEVNTSSPSQEIPAFYGALKFITGFKTAPKLSLFSARSSQSMQSDPTVTNTHSQFHRSCKSVLIICRTSTLSCELPSNNRCLLVISSHWLLYGHPTCKERFKMLQCSYSWHVNETSHSSLHVVLYGTELSKVNKSAVIMWEMFNDSGQFSQITWYTYTRLPSTRFVWTSDIRTTASNISIWVTCDLTLQHQLQQSYVALYGLWRL
jgi:hypothetical protein